MKFIDLTGQKFGRLTVVERVEDYKFKGVYWLCECECGNTKIVQGKNLKSGNTQSCGCFRMEESHNRRVKENTYEFYDEYVIGKDVCYNQSFIIDIDDYEKIKDITWTRDDKGYVRSTRINGGISLQRFIMDCSKGDGCVVDHIDGDINNNRKYNLRCTDKSFNGLNRDPSSYGKLGVLGVRKRDNRYEARIKVKGNEIFIGSYRTLQEAENARIQYEKKLEEESKEIINGRRL